MEQTKYIVIMADGKDAPTPVTKFASDIIRDIDMFDCYRPDRYDVYALDGSGEPKKLDIHGVWHEPDDPLYIKLTLGDKTIISGYGVDH